MAHPHLVKDIALQAGVSVATVDRVLNQRAGVRQHTQRRVAQALAELERQSAQVGLVGRKFLIDVVIQAPDRFTQVARAALERELPALQPPHTATHVRVRNGQRQVQDGPFADTREHLGGYFIVKVPSLDVALEWAARAPNSATGTTEVRPVLDMPPESHGA